MLRGGSIQLARVLGIRVGVDFSWFVVLFLMIWALSGSYGEVTDGGETTAFALAVASALLFFGSILLHELGHAVVALRNGIGIAGIDLWLFGGIAKMRREPDNPGADFRVAAAGPLVTLALAALLFGAGALLGGAGDFVDAMLLDPGGPLEALIGFLAGVNVLLLVFNLLPGLPLDGGRIVRAIVWWRTGDRARATRVAAALGRGFSYLLIGLGITLALAGAPFDGIWLAVVGLFIGQAARSEEFRTQVTARIEGLRVADVMDAEPVAVPSAARLDEALDQFFLRYRWSWFPVVDAAGRFRGYVRREQVDGVPEEERAARSVDDVMSRDAGAVSLDEPLEALLGSETLQRLGAIVAVDGEGVLRGVVTLDQVRRALRPQTPAV